MTSIFHLVSQDYCLCLYLFVVVGCGYYDAVGCETVGFGGVGCGGICAGSGGSCRVVEL